ncbi:hypothetical protein ACFLVX_04700 [Chloroflexota bacterium]
MITSSQPNIELDRKQVCRYIGYGAGCNPPARISSLVDEYIENARYLIEPSYSYVIRDIEWLQGSTVFLEGMFAFQSQVITRLLEQCHKVAVFLATIGNHLEETAAQLSEDGLMVQASVLDAVGSLAVDKLADLVHGRIAKAVTAQGLVTSQCFSPGYCDWDVGQQEVLFHTMNGDLAGIHLTEGCLMIPRKSISGIIGIGPSDNNIENYNPCKPCNKYDCSGRR